MSRPQTNLAWDTLLELGGLGWEEERQRGSHLIFHGGESLKPKTLSSIAEQAGIEHQ